MFDFHEKRKIRRIAYSKISIILIFLFAAFILFNTYDRFVVERDMAQKLETKKAELNKLNQSAEIIRAKVEHLKNDRGIEEELRNRFDVVKEGEQTVIIIDEEKTKNKQTTLTGSSSTEQEKTSSWLGVFKFW